VFNLHFNLEINDLCVWFARFQRVETQVILSVSEPLTRLADYDLVVHPSTILAILRLPSRERVTWDFVRSFCTFVYN